MSVITSESFIASLERAILAEMNSLVEQEAEAATERVRVRAREMAPKLAMSLLKNFNVSMGLHEILIRVRTEEAKP